MNDRDEDNEDLEGYVEDIDGARIRTRAATMPHRVGLVSVETHGTVHSYLEPAAARALANALLSAAWLADLLVASDAD